MVKTLFIFHTKCTDPKREQELSDWYDNMHIPDVEAVDGVVSCIRYKIDQSPEGQLFGQPLSAQPLPDGATYVSVILSRDSKEVATAKMREAVAKWAEQGRTFDMNVLNVVLTETVELCNASPQWKS